MSWGLVLDQSTQSASSTKCEGIAVSTFDFVKFWHLPGTASSRGHTLSVQRRMQQTKTAKWLQIDKHSGLIIAMKWIVLHHSSARVASDVVPVSKTCEDIRPFCQVTNDQPVGYSWVLAKDMEDIGQIGAVKPQRDGEILPMESWWKLETVAKISDKHLESFGNSWNCCKAAKNKWSCKHFKHVKIMIRFTYAQIIGLDDGIFFYRKALYLMVKTMVSYGFRLRFSQTNQSSDQMN